MCRWGRRASVVAPVMAVALAMDASNASAQTVRTDINGTAPSPRPPRRAPPRPATAPQRQTNAAPAQAAPEPPATGGIDRDKVPANTQVLTTADLDHTRSPDLLQSLVQALPGVSLSDQTGNPFQRDLQYRGFTASPVIGTPQGLAVYQNGVRINEVFGDTVNWDFIPDVAVHRLSLVPNNPVYGLNALGGAVSIEMKNGFTYQGKELEVMGGSFGRLQGTAQAGFQNGSIAGYASADAIHDKGWRQFASSSDLNRLYVDLGTRRDAGEFHLPLTGANTPPHNGPGGLAIPASATLGQIDRTNSAAASYGGTVQATSTAKILDHPNSFVVGMSIDRGRMQFNAASELGTVDNNLFVTG